MNKQTYILNIDTSVETAFVALSLNGRVVQTSYNEVQKDHAGFLHVAIREIIEQNHITLQDLKAVAVTEGPGSYTGLRVGMATAKGLCYSLGLPMITIGTLKLIAIDAMMQSDLQEFLICPMVDARRMEVFTATYNRQLHEIDPPATLILDEHSYAEILQQQPVVFCGNGAQKFSRICNHNNAHFFQNNKLVDAMAALSIRFFNDQSFADLVHTEPLYVKQHMS